MGSRLVTLGAIAGLVVAALGGVVGGMRLAERVNEPGTSVATVAHPASAPRAEIALRSPAGFTGFEAGALGGSVTRTGAIAAGEGAAFDVRSGASAMTVRATSTVRLYRIQDTDRPLAPGDVVVVRLDEAGSATAVLRIPPDLREGDSR